MQQNMSEGSTLQSRTIAPPSYVIGADPGGSGGGTYTGVGQEPSIQDYEAVFGPAARDIKQDPERNRRRQRLHLPDVLKGPNPWLTDRVDGLITDTSNSPFTSAILPYKHIENVDGKIKWNVWSFDEGMASRVPYESSARVLTQTKRSFAGYTVRQGLAISMEANFMMTPQGRENFKNQLTQVVGSIQQTNDLDVHIALLMAPSYHRTVNEKYFSSGKTAQQSVREYVELFGFLQKNPNALDIAIEEAKEILRSWGAKEPNFMLCNSKLTMQLTMTPERTQYLTQGYDGIKRLKAGPELGTYRGLKVIHSRAFSIETGARPRDLLNRRIRVAEYYRIPWSEDNIGKTYEFYDESRDSWFKMTWEDLVKAAELPTDGESMDTDGGLLVSGNLQPAAVWVEEGEARIYNCDTAENIEGCSHVLCMTDKARELFLAHLHLVFDGINRRMDFEAFDEPTFPDIVGASNVYRWRNFFMRCGLQKEQVELMNTKSHVGNMWTDLAACCCMHQKDLNMLAPEMDDAHNSKEELDAVMLVYAGLVCSDKNIRMRVSQIITKKIMTDLKSVFNALVQEAGKQGIAKEEQHVDPFLIFLYCMLFRKYFNRNQLHNITGIPQTTSFWHVETAVTITDQKSKYMQQPREIVIVRPNIEHNMLGVIMGRGGLDDLGGTLWGQTQLECYSDSMHGLWGMSYKYNERAIVWNEKNLVRLWDICYGSYSGGKDCTFVNWHNTEDWRAATNSTNEPYQGPSMAVMSFPVVPHDPEWLRNWPSPISFHSSAGNSLPCDPENLVSALDSDTFTMLGAMYRDRYREYQRRMPNFTELHLCNKVAGECAHENLTSVQSALAFQGSMRTISKEGRLESEVHGSGHHGPDYVGVASRRNGKGMTTTGRPGMPIFGAV